MESKTSENLEIWEQLGYRSLADQLEDQTNQYLNKWKSDNKEALKRAFLDSIITGEYTINLDEHGNIK